MGKKESGVIKKQPLEIKYVSPSELVPYLENPRINDHAVDPVKKSIEHFGFINPIIARHSDNMIIAGHTRIKAAIKAGIQHKIFDGRLEMAKSLQRQHPDIVKIKWKWGRWQHSVDYRRFRNNKLIKRDDIIIPKGVNNYGMILINK